MPAPTNRGGVRRAQRRHRGGGAGLWPIAALFAVNGMAVPSWLPRIPEVRERLDLGPDALGLALTGLAAGALLASPAAGRLVERQGSVRVAQLSGAGLAVLLWPLGAVRSGWQLFVVLALLGALDASMDIAMNTVGAGRERRIGHSVMHRLHGAWSAGMLVAALVGGVAAAAGVPVSAHLALVGLILLIVVGAAHRTLVEPAPHAHEGDTGHDGARVDNVEKVDTVGRGDGARQQPAFGRADSSGRSRRPVLTSAVVLLGAGTLLAGVVEGAPADWGALQLRGMGAGAGASAWAVVALSAGMLVGRLVGDGLTDRYGPGRVIRLGALLAGSGLFVGLALGRPATAAMGFGAVGLGMSVYFPLAFSVSGSLDGVSPGAGAAIVSTSARVGFLAGPLAIGLLASSTSLGITLGAVAAAALGLALIGPWFNRH